MAEEWAGVINTTSIEEMKGAEDHTTRNYVVLAKARKEGRMSFGHDGRKFQFQVDMLEHQIHAAGDEIDITYSRLDRYKQGLLDWRGYYAQDRMTEKEYLMNRGLEQLIDRYNEILPGLKKSMTNRISRNELWIDGNATGNEDRFHGVESFLAERTTPAATDLIAEPTDTYADLNTALADQGGTWSADGSSFPNATLAKDWPDGKGDSEYDYWAPLLINWSSTSWPAGTNSWTDNCVPVISRALVWQANRLGQANTAPYVFLNSKMFWELRMHHESKLRVIVEHKEAADLGFPGKSINQDGAAVMADFGVPANTGYGINFDELEMRFLYDQMFQPYGPERDPGTMSYLFNILCYGNIRWNPPGFFKLKNYA